MPDNGIAVGVVIALGSLQKKNLVTLVGEMSITVFEVVYTAVEYASQTICMYLTPPTEGFQLMK